MGTRYMSILVLRNLVVNKKEILWKIKWGVGIKVEERSFEGWEIWAVQNLQGRRGRKRDLRDKREDRVMIPLFCRAFYKVFSAWY